MSFLSDLSYEHIILAFKVWYVDLFFISWTYSEGSPECVHCIFSTQTRLCQLGEESCVSWYIWQTTEARPRAHRWRCEYISPLENILPRIRKIDGEIMSENWINTYQQSHGYTHLTKQLATWKKKLEHGEFHRKLALRIKSHNHREIERIKPFNTIGLSQ